MGTAGLEQYFCLWTCWSRLTAVEPYKPLRIFYLEEVEDPDTLEITVQQSSRPWNDSTDRPRYN